MAGRIRSLKPELWRSRQVGGLSFGARLTFIGLLFSVDDDGRGEDDARLIKADVYPYDDILSAEVAGHLEEMARENLIHRYRAADGRKLLHVLRFRDDGLLSQDRSPWGQKPQRALPSRLPDCGDDHGTGQGSLWDDSELFPGNVPRVPGPVPGKIRPPSPKSLVPSPNTCANPSPADLARFGEFYAAYPRHTARAKAEESWGRALRKASPDVIISGAKRYRDDPNRAEKYTAFPATWLNQGRWDDDPLPDRNPNGHGEPLDGIAPWS